MGANDPQPVQLVRSTWNEADGTADLTVRTADGRLIVLKGCRHVPDQTEVGATSIRLVYSVPPGSGLSDSDRDGERFDLECPECGAPLRLRDSRYGRFYGCTRYPDCQGSHGAHPSGRPLGVPATKAVKRARMRAHEVFDGIWKSGTMTRKDAYAWLARQLGVERVHMAEADEATCQRVIDAVHRAFPVLAELTEEELKDEGAELGSTRSDDDDCPF